MPDGERPSAEEILKAKDILHTQWNTLPLEHQATMLLVLLRDILTTEMSEWVLTALYLHYATDIDQIPSLHLFPTVTRDQLALVGIPDEEVATISDADLQAITRRMQARYNSQLFWEELPVHAQAVLYQKREQPPHAPPERE